MKTERDKLIDYYAEEFSKGWNKEISKKLLKKFIINYESINPQHETDGHQALEDNKAKKKLCIKLDRTCKYLKINGSCGLRKRWCAYQQS